LARTRTTTTTSAAAAGAAKAVKSPRAGRAPNGAGSVTPRTLADGSVVYDVFWTYRVEDGSRKRAWECGFTSARDGDHAQEDRPHRPQTNGKVERFHRTMAAEWAFARHYRSELERRRALPGWLHVYNHRRLHSAIGRAVPFSRLTNVSGQYN